MNRSAFKQGLPLACLFITLTLNAQKNKSSLCQAFAAYFPVGTAINPEADFSSPQRMAFIAKQYNSVTPENQLKPRQLHPQEFIYNWGPADSIVAFAKANNMKVRGHTLVWQQNVPEWMIKKDGHFLSKDSLYAKMKAHISTVMQHYKNDVYCWDVVNEAVSDKTGEIFRGKDPLYGIAGAEYVEMAFRFAREADPHAQLFYNDYRFSNPEKRQKIYHLLKALKEKGVPIDGIGIQSHYVPDEITAGYLQETIDMFSGLGLTVQVTELDVSVFNYRDKSGADAAKTDTAYTETRKKKQDAMYRMLFEVYRRNKDKISGVTFWGSSDMVKNFRTVRIGKMDYPFLFDAYMQPKQVYHTVTAF